MIRPSMTRGLAARGGVGAILAALLVSVPAAAEDVCHFVEVQCDRASKAVRIVPFAAADEECARLRALKDADWLVDVARHVRSGRGQMAPGQPKIVKCDLGDPLRTLDTSLPLVHRSQWDVATGLALRTFN